MADIASLGIRVSTQGVKEAGRDLDKLDKSAKGAAASTGGLGKTLAGLGGAALAGSFLKAVITNTIEAEKAQAQLAAVLKSTGNAAGLNAAQLNDMASALQSVTTFDDEAITGAQSLLLTFTKIGKDVFPSATEAVLDMSQALGQDLKSSALQLGKALNDPVKGVTALQRVGVSFSESQKDVIKNLVETGKAAEAQKIILAELTTEFGGSARAARNTLGGALEGLKNTFGDLLEGDTGGDGVRGATRAVNDLSKAINSPSIKSGIQGFTQDLFTIVGGAANATAELGRLSDRIGSFLKSQGKAGTVLNEAIRVATLSPFSLLAEQIQRVEDLTGKNTGGSSGSSNGRGRGVRVNIRDDGRGTLADEDKKSTARAAGLSAEQKATNSLAESYARMNAQLREEVALHGQTGKEATLAYQLKNGDLSKFTDLQKDSLLQLARSIDLLDQEDAEKAKVNARDQARNNALADHKKLVDGYLADIAFETKLLGLSNVEREKEIALRYAGADATNAERQALADAIGKREFTARQAEGLDDLRKRGQDLFVDLTDGVGSWQDAFDNAIDNFRNRMLQLVAEKLFEKLLPDSLATNSGDGGGFGSIISGLLGAFAGRAIGGPVSGGKLYEVGERGPELLRANGRNFMIPGRDGKVEAGGGKSSVKNTTINITVPGNTSKETAAQIAARVSQGLQLAGRDN